MTLSCKLGHGEASTERKMSEECSTVHTGSHSAPRLLWAARGLCLLTEKTEHCRSGSWTHGTKRSGLGPPPPPAPSIGGTTPSAESPVLSRGAWSMGVRVHGARGSGCAERGGQGARSVGVGCAEGSSALTRVGGGPGRAIRGCPSRSLPDSRIHPSLSRTRVGCRPNGDSWRARGVPPAALLRKRRRGPQRRVVVLSLLQDF